MRIYPELLVDQEFKSLGDQGFSGTLNDRQFAFLRSKGYTNSLADMIASWLSYSPVKLFTLSEPGIWLDPSDLTTMFQDRAGTTPVTTPGQSVGYRLDKSGNNNHATANSDAARGIYGIEPVGGRRNLLLATTTMATQNVTVTSVAHTLSFTGTGTVTLSGVSTAGPLVGTGENDRVSLTFTPTAGTLTLTVSGSVTLAQLELGSTATAYQRVTTQYDVTEAGKQTLHYVQYDGSDDGYVTPTITPGIDKAQVFAGVRKLSDAAAGLVLELSASISTNNGAISILAPSSNGVTNYQFVSKGTVSVTPGATGIVAPTTNVVTGLGDISGPRAEIRVNGTSRNVRSTSQGTGNYLAYPMYIGRRGGTTLPFNGRDYGIITRFGDNLDALTIAATESWLASKTGVTL